MAVVGAQLTLGTALSGLQADAKELPQRVAIEVGGGMKLTGDPAGLILIVHHTDL